MSEYCLDCGRLMTDGWQCPPCDERIKAERDQLRLQLADAQQDPDKAANEIAAPSTQEMTETLAKLHLSWQREADLAEKFDVMQTATDDAGRQLIREVVARQDAEREVGQLHSSVMLLRHEQLAWESDRAEMEKRLQEAEAACGALREALEPFARLGPSDLRLCRDEHGMLWHIPAMHVRQAQLALATDAGRKAAERMARLEAVAEAIRDLSEHATAEVFEELEAHAPVRWAKVLDALAALGKKGEQSCKQLA